VIGLIFWGKGGREMNDELETIRRRVKKLLALSKSPNENEAMVAPEKAQELYGGIPPR
jgi:hypothetical protein